MLCNSGCPNALKYQECGSCERQVQLNWSSNCACALGIFMLFQTYGPRLPTRNSKPQCSHIFPCGPRSCSHLHLHDAVCFRAAFYGSYAFHSPRTICNRRRLWRITAAPSLFGKRLCGQSLGPSSAKVSGDLFFQPPWKPFREHLGDDEVEDQEREKRRGADWR